MTTTNETRERSVAEIIGVFRHSPPITPDDMLAWLRGQGYTVTMKVLRLRDDVPTIWVESPTYKHAQTAPTLHAALEAAVRAVAEASDE